MMDQNLKEELIIEAASKVHEDWCNEELKAFFNRGSQIFDKTNNIRKSLEEACFKNGQRRNELEFDAPYLVSHDVLAGSCLTDFNSLKRLITVGAIEVKKFARRELTEEEIKKAGKNYKNGEENILRDFRQLSSASKKENLEAAIGAYNVYEKLSKASISIDAMENNPEIKNIIGVAIHTDWLKRNVNHPDDSLKVSYDKLDSWTKQQDLTVFSALLGVVKANGNKYLVEPVSGEKIPNYFDEEQELLVTGRGR